MWCDVVAAVGVVVDVVVVVAVLCGVAARSNTAGDKCAASMPWHTEIVVLDIRILKPPMEEINATGCVPRVLANARPSNVGTDRELAERKIDVHQHWRGGEVSSTGIIVGCLLRSGVYFFHRGPQVRCRVDHF